MDYHAVNRHCRIGKVRFKNGATIRLLPDKRAEEHQWLMADISRSVEVMDGQLNNMIAGYALVVWDSLGSWSAASRCGEFSPITETMVPSFVRDALLRWRWLHDARDEMRAS